MPNNTNERKGKQAGELSAEERFRNFFSTSVIDPAEEMTRRDEPAPVEEESPRPGCWASCSATIKKQAPAPQAGDWRSPPVRSCWGGRCKSRCSRAGGHGAGTAVPQTLFRQCRCSPPAQSLPRQFRQSRCLHQGGCCRAAGAGKPAPPAGAAACCSPPKAA